MKLGILGGTFDPVHVAHLAIAEQAREQLELDRVVFVPAWIAPHKPANRVAAARTQHRLTMLQLAIEDNAAFCISCVELDRGGVSYTIDTLRTLRAQYGSETTLYLLIGADNWAIFDTWREPEAIKELCDIAVYPRPGYKLPERGPRLHVLEGPAFDLSATWLRERLARGLSVRYLLPESVRAYVNAHHVYSPTEEALRGSTTSA